MKKIKYIILLCLISILISACSDKKTLTCDYSNENSTSKFVATVKDDKVIDMQLTTDMIFTTEQMQYKQQIIEQIKQKTDKVYVTDKGVKAIFDMKSDYFSTFGLSTDANYSELKTVLEMEGYTCS